MSSAGATTTESARASWAPICSTSSTGATAPATARWSCPASTWRWSSSEPARRRTP